MLKEVQIVNLKSTLLTLYLKENIDQNAKNFLINKIHKIVVKNPFVNKILNNPQNYIYKRNIKNNHLTTYSFFTFYTFYIFYEKFLLNNKSISFKNHNNILMKKFLNGKINLTNKKINDIFNSIIENIINYLTYQIYEFSKDKKYLYNDVIELIFENIDKHIIYNDSIFEFYISNKSSFINLYEDSLCKEKFINILEKYSYKYPEFEIIFFGFILCLEFPEKIKKIDDLFFLLSQIYNKSPKAIKTKYYRIIKNKNNLVRLKALLQETRKISGFSLPF